METINLSSDTQTLPTDEMFEAMRTAPLGDDMERMDPTVNKLEQIAAEKMGKEAALLVTSGTMGNLICLMSHASPGDEVLVDANAHIYYSEAGSMASIAGLMPRVIPTNTLLESSQVAAALRKRDQHFPIPRVLCLENTHNRSGGRVFPIDIHDDLCSTAKRFDLAVHLDGARIFNASVASGNPVTAYTKHVDSVMFCLSKGLSCPVGSIIAGTQVFIDRARLIRKRIGGAMRQAGIIAACGVVALESMIERLAEDHERARNLAIGINEISGLSIDPASVESNMVYVDHSQSGLSTEKLMSRLERNGILVSDRSPSHVRFVTNRHHDDETIGEALNRISNAMKGE